MICRRPTPTSASPVARLATILVSACLAVAGVAVSPVTSLGSGGPPSGGSPVTPTGAAPGVPLVAAATASAARAPAPAAVRSDAGSGPTSSAAGSGTSDLNGAELQALLVNTGTATAIAAGWLHTCALLSVGTVACWGDNGHGELGNGTTTNSPTPVAVSGWGGITPVIGIAPTAIAAGWFHTCALQARGTVKCWGYNDDGELGDGTTTGSSTPVAVSGIASATAIAAGGYQTCALLSGGTVKCWGYNGNGELGNGTTTDSSIPVAVTGITSATAIAAGGGHTCALLMGGTVACWGQNVHGQLGNWTNHDSSTPVAVTGITSATAIAAGGFHTCALLSGGVGCWGDNGYGQLGNGTTAGSSTPVAVSGITSATAISAGMWHTCALLSVGTVACWGSNTYGELGNGTTSGTNPNSTPVAVIGWGGITPVIGIAPTAIAAGGSHTCALQARGTVKCWGRNDTGQLGNGTTAGSSTPVAVLGLVATGVTCTPGSTGSSTSVAAGAAVSCSFTPGTGATLTAWTAAGFTPASSTSATPTFTAGSAVSGSITAAYTDAGGPHVVTFDYSIRGVPTITTNPISQTVAAGQTASFSAAATGSPTPTVRWQVLPVGGSWADVAGATATTYSFTATAADSGKQYRAVFTNSAGPATTTAATLTIDLSAPDTAPPTATPPSATLHTGLPLSGSAVPVTLAWTGSDTGGSGIARYELARSTNGGAWTTVSSSLTAPSAAVSVPSSGTVRFRVRGVDGAGNTGSWATGPVLSPRLVQQSSSAVKYTGTWTSVSSTANSGGSAKHAEAARASAQYTFAGRSIALVTTTAPTRGKVKVYVDGAYVATLDLFGSATTKYRVLAWQKTWSTSGTRTIKLVVAGTSGRPRVDLDAFAVLK